MHLWHEPYSDQTSVSGSSEVEYMVQRKFLAVAVVGSLALLALIGAPRQNPAAASGHSASGGLALTPEVDVLVADMAKHWGLDLLTAKQKIAEEEKAQLLLDAVAALSQDEFAGVYWNIEEGGSRTLVSAATTPAALNTATSAARNLGIDVTPKSVEFSLAALRTARERVLAAIPADLDLLVGLRFSANGLHAAYPGLSDANFEAEVAAAAAPVPVTFEVGLEPAPDSCVKSNCRETPGRGGLAFTASGSGNGCTGGFTAVLPNGDRGFLTARHCFQRASDLQFLYGQRVQHPQSVNFGVTARNGYAGVDISFVKTIEPSRGSTVGAFYRTSRSTPLQSVPRVS